MTKKSILQDQQKLIPLTITYRDKINLFLTSPKYLAKGVILFMTKSDVFLDFGTKPIIKTSKKLYLKNLVQLYLIFNTSYLLVKRPSDSQCLLKENLKEWIKVRLNEGQLINLKVDTINSIKNIHTINFKKTLEYIKYNKFFSELEMLKKSKSSIKGFIINSLKGGFSVVLGGLIAFLPLSQLVKKPHKTLAKKFINSSMEFRISKLTISKKNVVLIR